MTKPQICIIHGGTAFKSGADFRRSLEEFAPNYERLLFSPDWKSWLPVQLPERDVLLPSMPNKQNANYSDWSLYFSKIVPLLRPDAVLIGHSLGGVFLAKYFSEYPPAEKFSKIILIAAPYNDESAESLGNFKLSSAKGLTEAADELHLLYSRDDPVVPVSELENYTRDLPSAHIYTFDDKQHFNSSTLPELLDIIRG